MKYLQFVQQCNRFLLLNTNPELQWQILNKNISQNFSLGVSFYSHVVLF
jgi:hypothetical protein